MEIELENKSWDDKFSYLDTTLLTEGTRDNSKMNKKKNEKSNSSGSEEKLWFCSLYQRNKCSHDTHHLMVVKRKNEACSAHLCHLLAKRTKKNWNTQNVLPHVIMEHDQ
jgi:hypothetical protein